MNPASIILLGMLVVASSALVTYLVSVSRERLWLRSSKSEELYHKAEETYLELCNFFSGYYELSQGIVSYNSDHDMTEINRHIVDLRILVGLYFPSLGPQLSAAVAAANTAFDLLRQAKTADERNRERALQSLDYAVSAVKDSFDHFKQGVLCCGRVDKIGRISDALLNRKHRVQSERVLSVAA